MTLTLTGENTGAEAGCAKGRNPWSEGPQCMQNIQTIHLLNVIVLSLSRGLQQMCHWVLKEQKQQIG